ncbi:ATP-dependent Clp protease adapter ClpS [Castellaniella caeni]|uniref:ATP-dependent Clp protease adapter ClpS n=1 Tax=Castellaniella caeni TaxID=266123 RepID=UPI00082BF648|nr:ATP-dependent Clp protease adapter ClpS [Castellaniella caeni]
MPPVIENQHELAHAPVPVRLAPPPMYQVVLLNDDYTPMDFVVHVLQQVFHKGGEEAERIMLQVHHKGRGVCGIYTRDVAATRVDAVMRLAHADQHPLQCLMEPIPPSS